ncbi:MAG: bifunctional acetate--CoA ligase family protein/GNAT family N-acetyltransferase [Pseudomonadota bacterium]
MSVYNLDRMFQPKSVAVIGASDKKGSMGYAVMQNLLNSGYSGSIYPINPGHRTVFERPSHDSVADLDMSVDLAVVATRIDLAPQIIKECSQSGVGAAVIVSAGGRETGSGGRELEAAVKNEAARSGLRIIGPNCFGIICSESGLNASYARHMILPGKMAFISQSGAICTSILDLSVRERIGFSYFVSLGSMLDVDFGDVIDFLGGDAKVSSILMYVESLSRFRNFMSAARAVSRVKPIIVLKAGRSRAGARAAAFHTGALTSEDAVYDAAFKRAGIVRVKTFEELFDCAELLSKQPRPRGPGLAIITNAGGPGVMAADALADYGVEPAALTAETIGKLDEILPPHWSHSNPIHIVGDATPALYRKVVEICLGASEINGLLMMLAPQGLTEPTEVAEAVTGLLKKKPYPVLTSWMGGENVEKGRNIFNQAGIPTFDTPERAVRAFMDLYQYSINLEMLQEIPSKLPQRMKFDRDRAQAIIGEGIKKGTPVLNEAESKELLSAYGIPVNPAKVAGSEEEAVRIAGELGFPVAMKILSRDIVHKTEASGICLNVENAAGVRNAFDSILKSARSYNPDAAIEGISVQSMLNRPEYELILGSKRDRDFGPVILFGSGGVMAEILQDRALALPPLNRLLARRLMEETKIYRVLRGYRSYQPANLALLEEILIRLAQLVTDFSEIEEFDINPLFITKDTACVVDARVLLKPCPVPAPLHLVISPYPNHLETHMVTSKGIKLFLRPIRPEDAPIFEELHNSLSSQSIYYRFFSSMRKLPRSMLARFTQIDYDREVAFVALSESDADEKMLGVARIILLPDKEQAEFSVVVGDRWHGMGIGAELLKCCLAGAKKLGVKRVWGLVLAENTQMLKLGRKLGFTVKRIPQESDYEMSMDMDSYAF